MTGRTRSQQAALDHLRLAFLGPEEGPSEVIFNPPNRQYVVGMLQPRLDMATPASSVQQVDAGEAPDTLADVPAGDVEGEGATVPMSEDWRPSSVAISFVTDQPSVSVQLSAGTYFQMSGDIPPRWQRQEFVLPPLELSTDHPLHPARAGDVVIEIGSRWRELGRLHLVTVHVRVKDKSTGDDRLDATKSLYQVALSVAPAVDGNILDYELSRPLELDDEAAELRLRYRSSRVFAVGHGMAADWELVDGRCSRVFLDPVPAFVVPRVETVGMEAGTPEQQALELNHLAQLETETHTVTTSLAAFVDAFERWVSLEESRVPQFANEMPAARRIVSRSRTAVTRMREAIELLKAPHTEDLRAAFALGMEAMRMQMKAAASDSVEPDREPSWRPFQLGFLLVTLASATDDDHEDRDLVDLIWFPTGGGKTEAYLALAAIEIFRRRLARGARGGGTAVVTRYTLRLLTSQQFQRAAALICAMELLRRGDDHPRLKGMAPFSIGLWVGNEVTPGTRKEAKSELERLYKAARPDEANAFQIESCPWCRGSLLPKAMTRDRSRYGMRQVGHDVIICCPDSVCAFNSGLPVVVVDEALYTDPPTILLATVDKFARLQFRPEASRLLGVGTAYDQPSLIIQDELHLLSGPLGTTVAVFDGVIQVLLSLEGGRPKIVASTATIRASQEQVRGLYGREVALYPPAGLDADRSFFARPDATGRGRLYLGLMPQSVSQMSALVAASAPLIELPARLVGIENAESRDAYWTSVMYHNSLRELGRTSTLIVDDVNARLGTRAERLGLQLRSVRAGGVLELTSRQGADQLPKDLRRLALGIEASDDAVDVVLSSNMLSVGIDIPRLAMMLMVGQPKTTAEYIQATSRVGRGRVGGVVTTLFRSNRARDRSHFETFRGYHEVLYRHVEPTSVTPWSLSSRNRSLAGGLVALLRCSVAVLADNHAAVNLDLNDHVQRDHVDRVVDHLLDVVRRADPAEAADTEAHVLRLLRDWHGRAQRARSSGQQLLFERRAVDDEAVLKRFGQAGQGQLVADSMRSVDPNVAVEVREPFEGKNVGAH